MKLTISLVIWNGGKYLPYCFDSLLNQTFQDFDLLITDNGSSDNSVPVTESYLQKFGNKATFRVNSVNLGFAPGHNANMRLAQGEYVMLLNQDIILDNDYLELMVKFMNEHPQAGATSGKILRWDFANVGLNNMGKTSKIDSFGLKSYRTYRVIENGVGEEDSSIFSQDQLVFGVSGTVPLYRKEALESVRFENEYLDEKFFSYKEDVDLAMRLGVAGWESWVVATALAYHDRGAKSSENLTLQEQHRLRRAKREVINYNSYKNHLYLLIKNLSGHEFLKNFPWIISYELGKFFYLMIFENKTWRGLGEVIINFSLMLKKRKYIQQISNVKYQKTNNAQ